MANTPWGGVGRTDRWVGPACRWVSVWDSMDWVGGLCWGLVQVSTLGCSSKRCRHRQHCSRATVPVQQARLAGLHRQPQGGISSQQQLQGSTQAGRRRCPGNQLLGIRQHGAPLQGLLLPLRLVLNRALWDGVREVRQPRLWGQPLA